MTVRVEALKGLFEDHGELVQEAAGIALTDAPTVWTCLECGVVQSMTSWDCTACSRGARRSLEDEVRRGTGGASIY